MSPRFKQYSLKFFGSRGVRAAGSVLGLGVTVIGLGDLGAAPPPELGAARAAHYVQSDFTLPFQVKPGGRCPQRIDLIVSRDGGRTWQVHQSAAPAEGRFQFTQAEEGEYWLRVQARDAASSSLSPASMHLIVDRTSPVGTITCQWEGDNQLQVSCVVRDANLDPASLQLQIRTDADPTPQTFPLQIVKHESTQIDCQAALQLGNCKSFEVRLSGMDRAGNRLSTGERYFHPLLATVDDALLPPANGSLGAPLDQPNGGLELSSEVWNDIELGQPRSMTKAQLASSSGRSIVKKENPSIPTRLQELIPPAKSDQALDTVELQAAIHEAQTPNSAANSGSHSTNSVSASRQFKIHYNLDQLSASGDLRVELWASHDRGQSWELWGLDRDATSPATVEVEHDGEYGFCVVCIHSEADLQYRPTPGTVPDLLVTVKEPPKSFSLKPAARD